MYNRLPITDRKIRFALVGCGRIAKNHFASLARHVERACRRTLAGDVALAVDLSLNYWKDRSDPLAAQAVGFNPATTGNPFNAAGMSSTPPRSCPTA